MKHNKVKISIVIVNYNSTKNLNKLLHSLLKIKKNIKETIVVDNNSSDINLLDKKQDILLLKNKQNIGFSHGVNQGIKIAKAELILLLNPDSFLENKSVLKTILLIETNPKIGLIGGKIKKYHSDKYQYTATTKPTFLTGLFEFTNLKKIFPKNKYSKKFWVENSYKDKKPIDVCSLCGAYLILRKKLNGKTTLFNEKYFLYLEDIDLGISIIEKGYKVIFDPRSEITHIGGQSNNSKYKMVLKHWYKSRKIFFYNHINIIESRILGILFTIEEILLTVYHYIIKTPNE